jgi:hypothetical protein
MSAQSLLATPNATFIENIVTPTIQTNTINSSNVLSLNSNQAIDLTAGNSITLQSIASIILDGVTATAPAVALSTNNNQIATTASVLSLLGSYIQIGSSPTSGNADTIVDFPVQYATAPVVVFSCLTGTNDTVNLSVVNFQSFQVTQSVPGAGTIFWIAIGGNPV